jgi:hypothetical protein
VSDPVSDGDALALLGEGFHTALRKAPEDRLGHAHTAWTAIRQMDPADWEAVLRYVVDGMDQMGYVIVAKYAEGQSKSVQWPPECTCSEERSGGDRLASDEDKP